MAGLKVSIWGQKICKNWGFSPLKLNTPIGDKLFQDIPRHVAKFPENRPRDIEKSVDGKTKK